MTTTTEVVSLAISAKNNLIRCLRCRKVLIREEFPNHECVPFHQGVKYVDVSQWWETKTEYEEPLIMAFGLDGYTYRLKVVGYTKKGFEELNNHLTPDDLAEPSEQDGFSNMNPTEPFNDIELLQSIREDCKQEGIRERVSEFLKNLPPELATRIGHLLNWTV